MVDCVLVLLQRSTHLLARVLPSLLISCIVLQGALAGARASIATTIVAFNKHRTSLATLEVRVQAHTIKLGNLSLAAMEARVLTSASTLQHVIIYPSP